MHSTISTVWNLVGSNLVRSNLVRSNLGGSNLVGSNLMSTNRTTYHHYYTSHSSGGFSWPIAIVALLVIIGIVVARKVISSN